MSCQRVLPDALPPDDVIQDCHHVHLDPLPRQVSAARSFVREHAPEMSDDTTEALLLLTSELVTNAVLHARTPIEVGIAVAERSVLVAVHDEDLVRPDQRPYEPREGGWGLGLVAALATKSAMEVHPGDGKTAWFLLPRDGSVAAEDGSARRQERDDLGRDGR